MKAEREINITVEKDGRRSSNSGCGGGNIFWGLVFLLGAALFLAGKLGFLKDIGFMSIVFTIGLTAFLINGLVRRSFGIILFALAFLVIVNDERLGLEAITPWPVLGAALLGTIGLKLLFPGFHKHRAKRHGGRVIAEHRSGETVSYENSFGSVVRYVPAEILNVRLDNSFGSMEIYFSDALLKGHVVNVDVDSSFGNVTLYVPKEWEVMNNAKQAFGSVKAVELSFGFEQTAQDSTSANPAEASGEKNTLYITGEISFGALVIEAI